MELLLVGAFVFDRVQVEIGGMVGCGWRCQRVGEGWLMTGLTCVILRAPNRWSCCLTDNPVNYPNIDLPFALMEYYAE